jgi:hypothetical protein
MDEDISLTAARHEYSQARRHVEILMSDVNGTSNPGPPLQNLARATARVVLAERKERSFDAA